MNTTDTVTIVCCALLGILLFLLGANVTRHRASRAPENQMPSDPSDPLLIAQRAHGNAAEYIPTLIVLLLVCAALSDSWWVAALAIAAVAARTVHAIGILTSKSLAGHGPLRDAGALGTYLTGVALGVTVIVGAIGRRAVRRGPPPPSCHRAPRSRWWARRADSHLS